MNEFICINSFVENKEREITTIKKKKCSRCREWKPLTEFYSDNTHKESLDGFRVSCKDCVDKAQKSLDYSPLYNKNELKQCTKCGTWLPKTRKYFHPDKKKREGMRPDCKICRENGRMKRKYKIDLKDYKVMKEKQNNRCKICGKRVEDLSYGRKKFKKLCIDHNHNTGEIRGLLCDTCNRGIGFLQDNPLILIKAAKYLQKNGDI